MKVKAVTAEGHIVLVK